MRRPVLIVALALAGLAAGCGATKTVVKTTTVVQTPSPMVTGSQWIHGEIRSITRDGSRYLLVIDPSWFTSGITANIAQALDQHRSCKPAACPPVDNDNYIVDESHRTLTYSLPLDAKGTVLTSSSDRRTITAAQLSALVAGQSPLKLFESLASGVWVLVHIDTIRTFAQQYVP